MARQTSSKISTPAAAALSASFLSGAMMGVSLIAVPVLLDTAASPSHLLQQWARVYHYGHQIMPTMAVATFLLYGYSAISNCAAGRRWGVFAVAGVMTMIMVPFTWVVMAPTNNTLFRLEVESKAGIIASLGEAKELVTRWCWLHVVRSLFPLAGAIVGLMGTLW